MSILNNNIYMEEISEFCNKDRNIRSLKNKTVLITGASGLIGSYLVDAIMYSNITNDLNCKIIAISRDLEYAEKRFFKWMNDKRFMYIEEDINYLDIERFDKNKIDFIIHLASNTHPKDYSTKPIDTILTNIEGTKKILDLVTGHKKCKMLFTSSVEIYGENKGDVQKFDEKYLGYIDCNTLRAGYPEAKRLAEALIQSYIKEKNIYVVITRLARVFGPTMLMTDTKALSQFIKNGINNENIILKSEGNQYFSYLYVSDSVSAILNILLNGENGEAYNVSNDSANIKLKDLAGLIADITNTNVVFELPDAVEKAGYSTANIAILDNTKLTNTNWEPKYDIETGIKQTIKILENNKK